MNKLIALLFALVAGIYLLFLGWIPDPVPFLDEGMALIILVKSMSVLGVDLSRFLPFFGRRSKKEAADQGPVVDV